MTQNRKNVLVTGASSGIGKALAEEFARDGYNDILSARSASKMAAQAADLQQRYGITATVVAANEENREKKQTAAQSGHH